MKPEKDELNSEIAKFRTLAYRLAGALMDEIHYSQAPSEDSLTLLAKALEMFPDSDFVRLYKELEIAKMEPVE